MGPLTQVLASNGLLIAVSTTMSGARLSCLPQSVFGNPNQRENMIKIDKYCPCCKQETEHEKTRELVKVRYSDRRYFRVWFKCAPCGVITESVEKYE